MLALRALSAAVLLAPLAMPVPPAYASPQYVGKLACTATATSLGAGLLVVGDGGPAGVFDSDTGMPANPVTIGCVVNGFTFYSSPGVGVAYVPPYAVAVTAPVVLCFFFWAKLPDGTWIHHTGNCSVLAS